MSMLVSGKGHRRRLEGPHRRRRATHVKVEAEDGVDFAWSLVWNRRTRGNVANDSFGIREPYPFVRTPPFSKTSLRHRVLMIEGLTVKTIVVAQRA